MRIKRLRKFEKKKVRRLRKFQVRRSKREYESCGDALRVENGGEENGGRDTETVVHCERPFYFYSFLLNHHHHHHYTGCRLMHLCCNSTMPFTFSSLPNPLHFKQEEEEEGLARSTNSIQNKVKSALVCDVLSM